MPRKKFECSPIDPYHITARTPNKVPFPIEMDETWDIMSDFLRYVNVVYAAKIHSFVLMKNHFHLLASFPEANFSEAMQFFMQETSRAINQSAGRINQTYGARCFRSQITCYHHFLNVYKYVYQNPVRAKICDRIQDYKYSSAHGLLGGGVLHIPIVEDTLLFADKTAEPCLRWLNQSVAAADTEAMQRALRRRVFKFPTYEEKAHELDMRLL